MVGEVIVGLLVDSLALLADAGHMLTDAAAIGLALVAMRLAARPASGAYTFGLKRAEILSAQINGLTLAVLVVVFVVEGVRRLIDPPDVDGGAVALVAAVGILVNLVRRRAAGPGRPAQPQHRRRLLAHRHRPGRLRRDPGGRPRHLPTGWMQADAVATLVVAALMAVAAYRLLRDSARIFLEASPRGIEPGAVEAGIRAVEGVTDVHELHVWEVTSGFPALSAHVLVDSGADCHERRLAIEDGARRAVRHRPHHAPGRPPRRRAAASALGQRLHPEPGGHPHH